MAAFLTSTPVPKGYFDNKRKERKRRVILVKFTNGYLKPSRNSADLKFASFVNELSSFSKNPHRIVVANTSRLCYSGSNFDSDTPEIVTPVLRVCIFNKKKSTVELYEADLFLLRPLIKPPEIFKSEESKSYVELSTDLTLQFGSKTRQRSINTKLKYRSVEESVEAIGDGTLTPTLDVTMSENKKTIFPTESVSSAIPPRNSSAESVEDVYYVWDIISQEEYDALDSEADILLNAKYADVLLWKKENRYYSFITQYLEKHASSMDMHKAKLLCYVQYMLCFLRNTYADWKRKDPVPMVPEPFKQKLMDSYTVNKLMPQRLKDKLFAHALTLALMLNDYMFDGNTLACAAKISAKTLVSVAHALGCHVSKKSSNNMQLIELKLPLYEPKVRPNRRRT